MEGDDVMRAIEAATRAVNHDRNACSTNEPIYYVHADRLYTRAIDLYNKIRPSCDPDRAARIDKFLVKYHTRRAAMRDWLSVYRERLSASDSSSASGSGAGSRPGSEHRATCSRTVGAAGSGPSTQCTRPHPSPRDVQEPSPYQGAGPSHDVAIPQEKKSPSSSEDHSSGSNDHTGHIHSRRDHHRHHPRGHPHQNTNPRTEANQQMAASPNELRSPTQHTPVQRQAPGTPSLAGGRRESVQGPAATVHSRGFVMPPDRRYSRGSEATPTYPEPLDLQDEPISPLPAPLAPLQQQQQPFSPSEYIASSQSRHFPQQERRDGREIFSPQRPLPQTKASFLSNSEQQDGTQLLPLRLQTGSQMATAVCAHRHEDNQLPSQEQIKLPSAVQDSKQAVREEGTFLSPCSSGDSHSAEPSPVLHSSIPTRNACHQNLSSKDPHAIANRQPSFEGKNEGGTEATRGIVKGPSYKELVNEAEVKVREVKSFRIPDPNLLSYTSHLSRYGIPSNTPPPDDIPSVKDAEINTAVDIREPETGAWDGIRGLTSAKTALREALGTPSAIETRFLSRALKPWRAFLLYGPAGSGKHSFVNAVADAAQAHTVILSADAMSAGDGAIPAVRTAFQAAAARAPHTAIVLLDNADALFGTAGALGFSQGRHAFLDGMKKAPPSVVTIALSHEPWALDEGFRSRCERRLLIPLPDVQRRSAILHRLLFCSDSGHELSTEQIEHFAAETSGYSVRDLHYLMHDAAMEGVRYAMESTHFRLSDPATSSEETHTMTPCGPGEDGAIAMPWNVGGVKIVKPVTALDFELALGGSKPTIGEETVARHENFTKMHGYNGA